jgi:crotonobetainyl-CoA:carnitine CoA-transferase CaiB-like acyl-CoA transferase
MRPLDGIVVVAVEQAVAAPVCTRHLGAEEIEAMRTAGAVGSS